MHLHHYQTQIFRTELPDAGFYTWDVPENVLYADRALASLFGLDPIEAEKGLPIENYLKRVHPDDLPRLAKTISDSIVAHRPQQEIYRVMNLDGRYVTVSSFGRGFRDNDDQPVRYVGIVIPKEDATAHREHSH
ncbi:PAS domain-containing protein [Agrobacterium rosae]|uniref:PAS domain-containing protein n=1 Tax=Agrobacterium rosae TaxID=1972867 RepID=UPI0019D3AA4D|nr:PAS domain-containing protein [Agrobacterium rosae]MBN7808357.1 PAS domain-containing protein [Agrobacterium rosae]